MTPDEYVFMWLGLCLGGAAFEWLLGWAVTFGALRPRSGRRHSLWSALALLVAWPFFLGEVFRREESHGE
jgi:hypothetical protein